MDEQVKLTPSMRLVAVIRKIYGWGLPAFAFLLCLSAALVYVVLSEETNSGRTTGFKVLLLLATATSLLWGARAFTGSPFERRTEAVKFAYFAVLGSFAIVAIPPLVTNHAIGNEPIGIVSGCVQDKNAAAPSLYCGEEKPPAAVNNQWLINIGGTLIPQRGQSVSASRQSCLDEEAKISGAGNENTVNTVKTENTVGTANTPKAEPKKPQDDSMCQVGSRGNRAYVKGGLAMPLSYILIALVGGAVSLSRRVPEIQKCSEEDYLGTTEAPKMSPERVREQLIFQILQFLSAPLIAIVAYQVIQPTTLATMTGLAFMSGFGSEVVLSTILNISSAIKPLVAAADKTASIRGTVWDGEVIARAIDVSIPGGAFKARTDHNGKYVLNGIPAGTCTLEFSDRNRKYQATVTLVGGGAEVCDLDMATGLTPVKHNQKPIETRRALSKAGEEVERRQNRVPSYDKRTPAPGRRAQKPTGKPA